MSETDVKITGLERLPPHGTIIVPGSLNLPQLLALEEKLSGRPVTYLLEDGQQPPPDIQAHITAPNHNSVRFSRGENPSTTTLSLQKKLSGNGIVIFIPGLAEARPGTPCLIPAEVLTFLCQLNSAITPVAVHLPAQSKLSVEALSSLPSAIISFGTTLQVSQVSPANYHESLLEASELAFSSRKFLNGSLAIALFKGLKMHAKHAAIHDGTDDSKVPFSKILGVAIALSLKMRKATQKKRIGILLPPGKAGLIANLAVLFANKIPVNLNFTASKDSIRSSIKQADIDKFITADPFVRKTGSFPWPSNRELIFIERLLPQLKKQIILWVILSKIIPANSLIKMLKIGSSSGDEEAVLLFTSGSSGEPKGVPLTHRNLLANVCQFSSRISLQKDSKILGCLPLFHSFGCTATLWYPIIEGLNLVTYSSPLETKRLAALIEQHKVSLYLTTPTFLRGFLKRIEPEQIASLRVLITGAEKLPQVFADSFEQKFGIRPLEGYGLTETSPATNVNLPTLTERSSGATAIASNRSGSVGRLLSGIAARVTEPTTGEPQTLDQGGILWLKGANIFPGYLNRDDLSEEVFEQGWFKTNDVARFDNDGFLYIEGRLSRFSKIGGEMVPHEAVEAAIEKTLGFEKDDVRKITVIGIPDEQKGESLGLLSTVASDLVKQEAIDLRYKLLDEGFPALWCPKVVIPVREIPVLASGKLDLKACQALGQEAVI